MIVNPDKFQSIITDKKRQDHTKETFEIGDHKLNLNLHCTNICRSAASQLNVLIKLKLNLKRFSSFEAEKVLTNNYFYSNFNYCPLGWMFSSTKSLNRTES